MSYNLYCNDDCLGPVATTNGWYDFTRWITSIGLNPKQESDGLLLGLCVNGWSAGATTIRERLQSLLEQHGDNLKDSLKSTVNGLIALLDHQRDNDALIISDDASGRFGEGTTQLSAIGSGDMDVDDVIIRARRKSRV